MNNLTYNDTLKTIVDKTNNNFNELNDNIQSSVTVTVDTALSSTSVNPVQNKIIKAELDKKVNTADIVVPTRLSQLADDATHRVVTDAEKTRWNNKSDFNGSYNSLTNKPTIPNRLSQLTEDDSHMTVTKAQRDKIDNFTGGTGTSITVDSALSNTSENPVQNKAIKTALDLKVDKSSVITKLENEDFDNENPISAKALFGVILDITYGFEQKEVSIHKEFELVGLDKNILNVITKNWNDELGYTELWFVFYGRENNKDNTLEDGDGDDSISVNGVKVLERPLAYIRKNGTYFYTCGHFKLVGGFIFGTVARCDGNGSTNTITVEPVQATKIDDIIINTNNLFKGDSKFAVYAR